MILLYLLLNLVTQLTLIVTQSISGSSCAIMNQRMYITGGTASNAKVSSQYTNLITIQLNKSFDVSQFKLQDSSNVDISSLGSNVNVPTFGAIFGEGVNGTKLWMYGGDVNSGNSPLRYLDLSTGGFNNQINIQSPPNRKGFAWITHSNVFCMFGGRLTDSNKLTNEYWRFNTSSLQWMSEPSDDSLQPLEYHQSVFLTQNRFVILGGITSDGTVRDLSEIYIYDFRTNAWTKQKTTGENQDPIIKFMPVAYGNKIIIQGGASNINSTYNDFKIYSDVLVLDTTTWQWRRIQLKNEDSTNTNTNFARASYSAWTVSNQLVQFLGETDNLSTFNQAQIINLDNFLVAKQYSPPPQSWYSNAFIGEYDDNDDSKSSTNLPLIIGVTVGVIVLIIVIILIFFYYRRKVQQLKKEIPEPEPFLEPIQPNLNPLWSENDGTNSNYRPNSQVTEKYHSNNSMKYNSHFSDSTLNSTNRGSYNANNNNNGMSNNDLNHHTNTSASVPISPTSEQENPLFVLRSDTIMPGENYMSVINEKFVD
ncbi:hypothetical protein K502DRAFT_343718 [Neoconidiobolus thromboides FSU 785]|nr:hypothetical protein K502DRAFT_343718 [Neoconidiobolus thromboides FSU 785]